MIHDRITAWFSRVLSPLLMFSLPLFFLATPPARAEDRIVNVGVYENAPKIFIDESGKPAGIFIDIIEHIANSEGWKLHYVPGTWWEGLDRLAKGEIDLMPDVAYTADREKLFSFHKQPVLSSWFQVYARKGSGIRSILDLDGKRVCVLERSVQEEAFSRLVDGFGLDANLILAPDYSRIFEMVAKGEADAAITNRFYGLMHARKFGLEDTAVIFNPSTLFFAAPKSGHEQLLYAIDTHLLALKENPQSVYYESLKQWTSEQVHFRFPVWIQALGLVVGVVLLMSLVGSVILKRQVDVRTRALSKRNEQLAIMDRTLRSTTTDLHLRAILDKVLQGALDLTKLEGGTICLVDRESERLIPGAHKSATGEMTADLSSRAIQIGECLCGYAARDGESLILWDNASASAFADPGALCKEGIRFHAAFPLKVRNDTIGVLCIFSRTDAKPDPRKLNLVQDICGPVALAIENARLYE